MKFAYKTFDEKSELEKWVTVNQELISKIVAITSEGETMHLGKEALKRVEYTVWYWGNI